MRIKSLLVAGFAAGVALAAGGCDSNSTPGPAPTRTPIPSAQTEPSTQPGRTSEPGGSVPEATAAPDTPGVPDAPSVPTTKTIVAEPKPPADTAPPKCVTAQLRLDKGIGGQVGGTWFLRFINSSSRTCVLQGFPGVSQTNGPTGDPVGEPATRDQGPQAPQPAPVTLTPGGAAQFEFISYPKQINECAALRTNTLRVYPPDNTESLWLPWDNLICPSPQHMLVVRAITPL